MHRTLRILGRAVVQALAFAGLALFVYAAVQLSTGVIPLPDLGGSTAKKDADGAESGQIASEIDPRPVVVIDAGHGGKDGGTVAGGALEKALNIDVSKRVAQLLEAGGVRVEFTRDDDEFVGLDDRARFANGVPKALFVSIHHNASTSKIPSGIETYYSYPKPNSVQRNQRALFGAKDNEAFIDRRGEELARRLQTTICDSTNAADRGIKNHPFAVTRWVSAPAVLVECGFLSNPAECAKLRSDSYRDKLSRGIADGLLAYIHEFDSDPLLGISFPDRVTRSELADILAEEPGS